MAYIALAYSYWASFHDIKSYYELLTTCMDAYVTPTEDTDYSCHIKAIELFKMDYVRPIRQISHRTYLTNHMGSITRHITPLVIHSFWGRHTLKHTCIQAFMDKSILRNQACADLEPAHSWFKNLILNIYQTLVISTLYSQAVCRKKPTKLNATNTSKIGQTEINLSRERIEALNI